LPLPLVDDWPLMMRAIDEGRQRKHDRDVRRAEMDARSR